MRVTPAEVVRLESTFATLIDSLKNNHAKNVVGSNPSNYSDEVKRSVQAAKNLLEHISAKFN